jgi:hypothetical protein
MDRAAMPEATIDENRHPDSTEDKVWTNSNAARSNWKVPAIAQSATVEERAYFQLWTSVAPSIGTTRRGCSCTAWVGAGAAHDLLP